MHDVKLFLFLIAIRYLSRTRQASKPPGTLDFAIITTTYIQGKAFLAMQEMTLPGIV